MTKRPISITEVLGYANHDFVNYLHLIRMNLDLGRVDEAKEIIRDVSENYRLLSNINRLQLPQTSEWLHTCRWRFRALQVSIHCNVETPVTIVIDDALVQYLEKTVIHVYDHLDPFTEQRLHIDIKANDKSFSLKFDLKGLWDTTVFQVNAANKFDVQTIEETTESWVYELNAIGSE